MASISSRHELYSWHRQSKGSRERAKSWKKELLPFYTTQVHLSPTSHPSSLSLISLLQVNKMRSNSLRELMPGRTRPGYHLLLQALVSSFTRCFIHMCSHHHDSEPFVVWVITCLFDTLLLVMKCNSVQRIFNHIILCVKYSWLKLLLV